MSQPELLTIYEIIAQRRVNYDTMSWQTPALSFTAQAFLFTTALSADVSQFARVLSSGLALLVSFVSIHLLSKHQHLELVDSVLFEGIEQQLRVPALLGVKEPPHAEGKRRIQGLHTRERPIAAGWFVRQHAPRLWTLALALFALAAMLNIAVALLYPSMLQ